jgi:Helix-turn-helix domain
MTSLGMLSSEALAELVNLVADEVEQRPQRVGTATTLDRWLTVEQAAAYVHRPRSWIYDARSGGRLKRTGTGGCALVDRRELDRIIESGGV